MPYAPYLSECGVLCRLFPVRSFHNLQQDKRKSAPHFLYVCPKYLSEELQILVELSNKFYKYDDNNQLFQQNVMRVSALYRNGNDILRV